MDLYRSIEWGNTGTMNAPLSSPARAKQVQHPIPRGIGLRVVGDVHGDARAFAAALQTDRFVVQLGDLTDYGPDSAACLDMALNMQEDGRGLFLLGNHDLKLARALLGQKVRIDLPLAETLDQLDDHLRRRVTPALLSAPAWIIDGPRVFVHGGFHTEMLDVSPPTLPDGRVTGVLSRALYGEHTGRSQPDGYPERSLRWVDRIPQGMIVYCGHDRRSTDGRPYIRRNLNGGVAVFLDTGAGKGGHLSWIDLPPL